MKYLLALWLLCSTAHAQFMTGGWDWEVNDWRTRIRTNSGTLNVTSYWSGTQFMQSIKRWHIRPQVVSAGLYLGGETNAVVMALIHDLANTAAQVQLFNFAAADYSEAVGLTGNTTTKYILLSTPIGGSVSMNQIAQFAHLGVYVRSNVNANFQHVIGASTSVGDSAAYVLVNFSGLTYGQCNDTVALQWNSADTNGTGMYLAVRTATNFAATYRNGAQLASQTGNLSGTHNSVAAIALHAFNTDGTVAQWSSRTLAFWTVGFGLTPTEVSAYYKAVQRLQFNAGRAIGAIP